jgi:hypothetical protein
MDSLARADHLARRVVKEGGLQVIRNALTTHTRYARHIQECIVRTRTRPAEFQLCNIVASKHFAIWHTQVTIVKRLERCMIVCICITFSVETNRGAVIEESGATLVLAALKNHPRRYADLAHAEIHSNGLVMVAGQRYRSKDWLS